MNKKIIIVAIVSVLVGLFAGAYLFKGVTPPQVLGSASDCYNGYTCFTYVNVLNDLKTDGTLTIGGASTFSSTVTIGTGGSALSLVKKGTCNFLGMDASQLASTSVAYDCAVSGVVAGDVVVLQSATTTPTTFLGWNINGANASSTSGFITAYFTNQTGADKIPSTGKVGSSTQYIILR